LPENCPILTGPESACNQCSWYRDDYCSATGGGLFKDILTVEERLERLERKPRPEKAWSKKQWKAVEQIVARMNYLDKKYNEHLDKSKSKRKDKI